MTRESIVWLASYPKTGSTWLRILINLVVSPQCAHMESIPSLGKEFPDDAPLHDFRGEKVKIVKTHFYADHPMLQGDGRRTAGVISIYRHPLDILLSSINYSNIRNQTSDFKDGIVKSVEEILADGEMDYYIDSFIKIDGFNAFRKMCQKWSLYQKRWDQVGSTVPYLKFCYEDLVSDPISAIQDLHAFFGKDCNEAKASEIAEKAEMATQKDGKFFWRKRAFNFQKLLPQPMIDRFCDHYQQVLVDLGY